MDRCREYAARYAVHYIVEVLVDLRHCGKLYCMNSVEGCGQFYRGDEQEIRNTRW